MRGIAESGEWAERDRLDAAKVAAPFFRQDENLLRFVLTKPPDRVSYRMLNPSDEEMQRIADMAVRAGLLQHKLDVRDVLDRSFIPADIRPAEIDASADFFRSGRFSAQLLTFSDYCVVASSGLGLEAYLDCSQFNEHDSEQQLRAANFPWQVLQSGNNEGTYGFRSA